MSKYFGFVKEEPFDFEFKKIPNGYGYVFKLGENPIAQLICQKKGWTCVILESPVHYLIPTLVEGFKTRHDAIDYALKVHPLTYKTYSRDLIEAKEANDRIDAYIGSLKGE